MPKSQTDNVQQNITCMFPCLYYACFYSQQLLTNFLLQISQYACIMHFFQSTIIYNLFTTNMTTLYCLLPCLYYICFSVKNYIHIICTNTNLLYKPCWGKMVFTLDVNPIMIRPDPFKNMKMSYFGQFIYSQPTLYI